jgi:hypothetical protein
MSNDLHQSQATTPPTGPAQAGHDRDVALRRLVEAGEREAADDRRTLDAALQAWTSAPKEARGPHLGAAVLGSLRAMSSLAAGPATAGGRPAAALGCRQLLVPRFNVASSGATETLAGRLLRFSRADAQQGTMELASATGEFGGGRWPPSETVLMGLNRASAVLGGNMTIPEHAEGSTLTVTARVHIENIVQIEHASSAALLSGSALLYAIPGSRELPLRGSAVVWCDLGLTVEGSGRTRTRSRFASRWANADGSAKHDLAPDGLIVLTATVALRPATRGVNFAVDAACSAFAEQSPNPYLSAFSVFDCHDKTPGTAADATGLFVVPARLRVVSVAATLCELPLL